MSGNMDDDDDFGFFSGGKSRLSSLFPSQAPIEEDVNQSLIYVAPKQPKKNEEQSGFSFKNLNLIHAVPTYTYKFASGKYTSQGKLGAAILGDHHSSIYKLLLYTGKKQQVAVCTINMDFKFTVEANWYARFSDDKGELWSVKFGTEEMLIEFAKQVALAKANSFGTSPTKLIVQDLVAGDGSSVDQNDSVGISYTGWLFKNHGFGEVFDENSKSEKPFIVKLGKGNAIKGLCDGLLGAKKNTKRLLIIPPSLGYGSDGLSTLIPPSQMLIFEVVVKKIKVAREVSSSPSRCRSDSEVKPDVPPRTHSLSEDTIRSRGASISEQLTQSPRKDNAKIISRMAKIGMPSLPLQGAIAAQTSSESEPEKEVERERHSASPKPSAFSAVQNEAAAPTLEPHNVPRRSISSPRTSSPLVQVPLAGPQHTSAVMYPAYSSPAVQGDSISFLHQPIQAHPSFMTPVVPGLMESHLPLLVTETRTQSTEIRLMLNKISDRLDSVMPKLEEIKFLQGNMSAKNQVPYMESTVLAQNIERIIQENVQMKKENETKTSKIQELNEKICDILQRNQRFFEESNSILEQRSDSLQMTTSQLQNKVLALEQEKVKLSTELSEAVSSLHKALMESNEKERLNSELSQKLEESVNNVRQLQETIDNLKSQNAEKKELQQSHTGDLEEWKRINSDLTLQVEEMHVQLKEAKEMEAALVMKLSNISERESSEIEELKKQIQVEKEKLLQSRKKYESLMENTRMLKNRYDSQIESLLSELKEQKLLNVKSKEPSEDFSAEIKKAMNMLYKVLQSEVDESQTYSSTEVLNLTLGVIRRVTLRFIGMGQQHVENSGRKTGSTRSSRTNSIDRSSPKNIAEVNADQVNTSTVTDSAENSKSRLDTGQEAELNTVEAKEEHGTVSTSGEDPDAKGTVQMPENNDQHISSEGCLEAEDHKKADGEMHLEEGSKPLVKDNMAEAVNGNQDQVLDEGNGKDAGCEEQTASNVDAHNARKSPDIWRPQPPTPPLFDEDEEDEDDWLK